MHIDCVSLRVATPNELLPAKEDSRRIDDFSFEYDASKITPINDNDEKNEPFFLATILLQTKVFIKYFSHYLLRWECKPTHTVALWKAASLQKRGMPRLAFKT